MRCRYCGAEIYNGSMYCPNCGQGQAVQPPKKKTPVISWICCGLNLVNYILVSIVGLLPLVSVLIATVMTAVMIEERMESTFTGAIWISGITLFLIGALALANFVYFIYMLARYRDMKKHFVPQWVVIGITMLVLLMTVLTNAAMFDGVKGLYAYFIEEGEVYELEDMTEFNEVVVEDEIGIELPFDFFAFDTDEIEEELEDVDDIDDISSRELDDILESSMRKAERETLETIAVPAILVFVLCGVEAVLMIQYKKKEEMN